MDEKLVVTCHMFMVPATILVAALGLAATEALKTLLCFIGLIVSGAWFFRLLYWTGLSGPDQFAAFTLAITFLLAAMIALVVHFILWREEWGGTSSGFLKSLR
jgi:hypothetical protein